MTKTELHCINRGYKIIGSKKCQNCGLEFNIYDKVDIKRKKYCSVKCRAVHMGKINSERMKLGLIPKPPNHTPESIEKMKETCRNREMQRKSPFKRLIKRNISYETWRKAVYERDGYKCQKCGNRQYIHAHHIRPFSEILNEFLLLNSHLEVEKNKDELFKLGLEYSPFWDVNNGQTLCEDCHQGEHTNNVIKRKRKI